MVGIKQICKKGLFALTLCLVCSSPVFSQPESKVIDYQTIVKLHKNKLVEEESYLIQIGSSADDRISDVELSWQKGEKIELLEAHILDAQNRIIRKLGKKEIKTRNANISGTFFDDYMIQEFQMRSTDYPYRIRYRYRRTSDKFIYLAYWNPCPFKGLTTVKASLQIQVPEGFKVNMMSPPGFNFSEIKSDQDVLYTWKVENHRLLPNETYSPPSREVMAKVIVVPQKFNYGMEGSFDSWSAYGLWQEQMNEGMDVLPESEKAIVNKLVSDKNDKEEIIRTLYHHLQDHTRYINVSLDIGGLKPWPASYVCENKYGDCKALTMYMKALLKHAGIPSYYTKVYAGNNPVKMNRDFPSQQFNHVILCIPLENDTIWLENTAGHLPANYLGTFTQGRYALLVNGVNSQLVKTPALQPEDVLESNNYTFRLDEVGSGSAIVKQKMKGRAFEHYRYIRQSMVEKDQQKQIEKRLPMSNYEITGWKFIDPDRNEPQIQLKVDLSVRNQIRNLGKTLAIRVPPGDMFDPEAPDSRMHPVRVHYPVHRVDTITYELPFMDGYTVQLPEPVQIKSPYGSFTELFQKTEGQVIIVRDYLLVSGEYPLAEYPGFYSFIAGVNNALQKNVILLNSD